MNKKSKRTEEILIEASQKVSDRLQTCFPSGSLKDADKMQM